MLSSSLPLMTRNRLLASGRAIWPTAPAPAALPAAGFRLTYLPALDGLRGLACLLVMGFHILPPDGPLPGGFIGVDIFFVLSGFLITSLLLQEWEQTGAIDLKRFFVRRALRLMPALFALLAICWSIAHLVLTADESALFTKSATINLLFQANRMDILDVYRVGAYLHTWSLAVEDKFYLVWPVALCAALVQKTDRRWLLFFVVLAIAASAGSRAWLHCNGRGGPELYFGLDYRADGLLMGCLFSMLAVWNQLPRGRWFRVALRVTAIASWSMLAFTCLYATRQAPYLFRGVNTLIAFAAAVCILSSAIAPMRVVSWILERRFLVATGRLSYGLYLWHWPILWAMETRFAGYESDLLSYSGLPTYVGKAAVIPLSFLVAVASYYLLEKPFLRLRPARYRIELLRANEREGQIEPLGLAQC